jgi:hypothetical protein
VRPKESSALSRRRGQRTSWGWGGKALAEKTNRDWVRMTLRRRREISFDTPKSRIENRSSQDDVVIGQPKPGKAAQPNSSNQLALCSFRKERTTHSMLKV